MIPKRRRDDGSLKLTAETQRTQRKIDPFPLCILCGISALAVKQTPSSLRRHVPRRMHGSPKLSCRNRQCRMDLEKPARLQTDSHFVRCCGFYHHRRRPAPAEHDQYGHEQKSPRLSACPRRPIHHRHGKQEASNGSLYRRKDRPETRTAPRS